MLVTRKLDPHAQLSAEQLQMLEEAERRPIVYDEDSPRLTEEQMRTYLLSHGKAEVRKRA